MKHLFLPMLVLLLSLCSCNHSKLEWWESVNTPKHRTEQTQATNDDSNLEKTLFNFASKVEDSASSSRRESWISSGEFGLVALSVVYYLLVAALIGFGIFCATDQGRLDSSVLVLAVIGFAAICIGIPYMLLVDNGTQGGSLNYWQIPLLVGLILSIPTVTRYDAEVRGDDYDMAEIEYGVTALSYYLILPCAAVLGMFIRPLATFGSYLFLVGILLEIILIIVSIFVGRASFIHALISIVITLFFGIGTVVAFYGSMATLSAVSFELAVIVAVLMVIGGVLVGGGSSSSSSSSSYPSSSSSSNDRITPSGDRICENCRYWNVYRCMLHRIDVTPRDRCSDYMD